jgi:hypothetical protein
LKPVLLEWQYSPRLACLLNVFTFNLLRRYTWTDTLGFPVMGIWQDDSDGTDINSVDRADVGAACMDDTARGVLLATAAESADRVPGAGYLVTADDFAFVKLFNFPVVWDDAPFKCFRGHSSHVTCVRCVVCDGRGWEPSGWVSRCMRDKGLFEHLSGPVSVADEVTCVDG